jgi:DNA gyrase/topoisomerase IV subunit A
VDTGLASDFLSDGEELIEVAMSETQFARMITSIGMGAGGACTIRRFEGAIVEEPPIEDRKSFVVKSYSQQLDEKKAEMSEMLGQLQRMRSDKKRPTLSELDDLISKLAAFVGNQDCSSKFYREQFVEEIESIVDEAKTEIEAHLLQSAGMLGIESSEAPKLQ